MGRTREPVLRGGTIGVLILSRDDIRQLLTMRDCIDAVRTAFRTLAAGEGVQPLRPVMWLPDRRGALGMMPGYLAPLGVMGIKTVSVFPGNTETEFDSHQGTVMLFETENGRLLALVDASETTAMRTAAASAVATDALARPDASVLAVIGTGVQARAHIEAIPEVRGIGEVRVWGRTPERARALVESAPRTAGMSLSATGSVADAVAGADIVCTTTAASEPVLTGDLLEPGMHINAVGSSVPFARELDGQAVARSRLFVDRRESTLNESGDFLLAVADGAIGEDHILAEIGDVLVGGHPGRAVPEEITLFESLGIAAEDIATSELAYRRGRERGVGTEVDIGGLRHG